MSEVKLTDKEVLEDYVNDPKKRDLHAKMADVLSKQFKGKWFTTKDINKMTAIKSSEEAAKMVFGLTLFEMVATRTLRNKTQYRVTLTTEDKLRVLEEHKQTLTKQIAHLDIEIDKLKSVEDLG